MPLNNVSVGGDEFSGKEEGHLLHSADRLVIGQSQ